MNSRNDSLYRERVFNIVRKIPTGQVMTYGQIAATLGDGYTPRTVGYVMRAADDDVPWQRVINSQGKCSTGRLTMPLTLQQELLEAEGIVFNASGRCDMRIVQWLPEGSPGEDDPDQIRLFTSG